MAGLVMLLVIGGCIGVLRCPDGDRTMPSMPFGGGVAVPSLKRDIDEYSGVIVDWKLTMCTHSLLQDHHRATNRALEL